MEYEFGRYFCKVIISYILLITYFITYYLYYNYYIIFLIFLEIFVAHQAHTPLNSPLPLFCVSSSFPLIGDSRTLLVSLSSLSLSPFVTVHARCTNFPTPLPKPKAPRALSRSHVLRTPNLASKFFSDRNLNGLQLFQLFSSQTTAS